MPPGTDYPDRTVVSAELSAWRFAAPVAIIALVLLAYIPALDASFVNWDDYRLLFNETTYQNLNAEGLRWMFTTSYAGHFQPLTWLSYSLDYAVWGRSAFGFHLTNVVLHMAVAVTFYLVGRRLLAVGTGIDQAATSRPLILSASFAAVLFAVHPLRAESVAWVSERRDVLSGLFFVLAVGFYVWFATSAGRPACTGRVFGSPRRHRCYYAAALACCLLSLLAKATAMTLPLVLLVLDVYPLRRLGGAASAANRGGGRVWSEKIPFFLLAFAAGLRALLAQEEGGALYQLEEHGVPARFGQACYGLGFYLRKTCGRRTWAPSMRFRRGRCCWAPCCGSA